MRPSRFSTDRVKERIFSSRFRVRGTDSFAAGAEPSYVREEYMAGIYDLPAESDFRTGGFRCYLEGLYGSGKRFQ